MGKQYYLRHLIFFVILSQGILVSSDEDIDELSVPHIQQKRSTSGHENVPEGQYYYLPSWVDVYENGRKIGVGTLRDSFMAQTNAEFIRDFNSHFTVSYREPFTGRLYFRDVSRVTLRPVAGNENNNERYIAELHLTQLIPRERIFNHYYFPESTNH